MRNTQYLGIKDIKRLFAAVADIRDRLLLQTFYETGCNVSELVLIKAKEIKGNSISFDDRHVKISGRLAKDLRLYIDGNKLPKEHFVFYSRQADHLSEKRVQQLINKYTYAILQKKINPQTFRYLHIVHAYLNGVLLETISSQLGITTERIHSIISSFDLTPRNNYHMFLRRVSSYA